MLRREKVQLTSEDRARLLALAKDLSYVWHARSTTNAERKNLLRILVREVALSPVEVPERAIHIQVLWQTGTCSDLTIARRPSYTRATSPETIKLIGTLVEQKRSDREIAAELNQRGLLSGVKRAWDKQAVRWVRRRYGIHRHQAGARPPQVVGWLGGGLSGPPPPGLPWMAWTHPAVSSDPSAPPPDDPATVLTLTRRPEADGT